jgi:hypothetical protein
MIASIELKSTDFNDENFSPVFNRATKEFFLYPGEKMLKGKYRINAKKNKKHFNLFII